MNKGELLMYNNQLIVVEDERGNEELVYIKNQNAYYALHSMKAVTIPDYYLNKFTYKHAGNMKAKSLSLLKKLISIKEKRESLKKQLAEEVEKFEKCRLDYKDSFKKIKTEKAIDILNKATDVVLSKKDDNSMVHFYFADFDNNKIQNIYATVSSRKCIPGRREKYNSENTCSYLYREYDGSLHINTMNKGYAEDLKVVSKILDEYAHKTRKSKMFDIKENYSIHISDKGTLWMEKEIVFSLETPLELTEANLKQVIEALFKSYSFNVGSKSINFPDRY